MVAKNSRTATLGPRKIDLKDIIVPKYKAKLDETIPKPTQKKKSILDYNSSNKNILIEELNYGKMNPNS